MHIPDLLLLLAVAAAVGFAVWRLVKNRREGKSPCGCDCGHCAQGCGSRKSRPPKA